MRGPTLRQENHSLILHLISRQHIFHLFPSSSLSIRFVCFCDGTTIVITTRIKKKKKRREPFIFPRAAQQWHNIKSFFNWNERSTRRKSVEHCRKMGRINFKCKVNCFNYSKCRNSVVASNEFRAIHGRERARTHAVQAINVHICSKKRSNLCNTIVDNWQKTWQF